MTEFKDQNRGENDNELKEDSSHGIHENQKVSDFPEIEDIKTPAVVYDQNTLAIHDQSVQLISLENKDATDRNTPVERIEI